MENQPSTPPRFDRAKAWGEFRRMLVWIAIAGVLLVVASLWYLSLYDALYPSAVLATIGGVFISMMLGCGLFAAAFFSDKSGHDDNVTSATVHSGDSET
ncbi:MAG: hypothetical protein V4808_08225 [Pseudomonadota bacterium]